MPTVWSVTPDFEPTRNSVLKKGPDLTSQIEITPHEEVAPAQALLQASPSITATGKTSKRWPSPLPLPRAQTHPPGVCSEGRLRLHTGGVGCVRACSRVHSIADGLRVLLPPIPTHRRSLTARPSLLGWPRCLGCSIRGRMGESLQPQRPSYKKPFCAPVDFLQCSFWGMHLPHKRLGAHPHPEMLGPRGSALLFGSSPAGPGLPAM